MRVILAGNLSLRAAAGCRVADNGHVSAGQANERVDILDDNTDRLEDESGSGVGGGDNAVAADVTGGGRWAVVALRDGDRDTADGDELGVRVVLAGNFGGVTTAKGMLIK
jgi:hypothetical protein